MRVLQRRKRKPTISGKPKLKHTDLSQSSLPKDSDGYAVLACGAVANLSVLQSSNLLQVEETREAQHVPRPGPSRCRQQQHGNGRALQADQHSVIRRARQG